MPFLVLAQSRARWQMSSSLALSLTASQTGFCLNQKLTNQWLASQWALWIHPSLLFSVGVQACATILAFYLAAQDFTCVLKLAEVAVSPSEPHPLPTAHLFCFCLSKNYFTHTHKLGGCGGASVTPALRKLRQESCCEFKASLCYIASQCCIAQPCLKTDSSNKKGLCRHIAKYPWKGSEHVGLNYGGFIVTPSQAVRGRSRC